jgi:hypothetical protein
MMVERGLLRRGIVEMLLKGQLGALDIKMMDLFSFVFGVE